MCYVNLVGAQPFPPTKPGDGSGPEGRTDTQDDGENYRSEAPNGVYTQEQVADQLGIGIDAFSRIERRLISPGIPKLYLLAELFECSIESFFVKGSKRVSRCGQI